MKKDHLSELQVQQYALEPQTCEAGIEEHIHACADCKARVMAYRVLFTGISEQPAPVFDFDISALVVPQLEKAKPRSVSAIFFIIIALATVIFLSVAVWSFRKDFAIIFTGVVNWFIGVIIVAAIGLIIFQAIELYRKYHWQMNQLQFE